MKLVHSSKTKRAARRWYGEEAELLTDAEQAAHDARMAQMEAGTYDWSNTLQPAPTRKPTASARHIALASSRAPAKLAS